LQQNAGLWTEVRDEAQAKSDLFCFGV